jgi:hypothetical protein
VNSQAMRIMLALEKDLPNRKRSPDPRTIQSSISWGYSLASATAAWHYPARNLRCDQESHNHRRHTYQSQELIYRSIAHVPQMAGCKRLARISHTTNPKVTI